MHEYKKIGIDYLNKTSYSTNQDNSLLIDKSPLSIKCAACSDILIIDDNSFNIMAMKLMIEELERKNMNRYEANLKI